MSTTNETAYARRRSRHLLLLVAGAFVVLVVSGTVLFVVLADEPWDEAVFRSISAFTPSAIVPEAQTRAERAITAVLVLSACAFYLFAIGTVVREVGARVLSEDFLQKRKRRQMQEMTGHYIVCGYGNVGRAVTKALLARGESVVVVDMKEANVQEAGETEAKSMLGRASESATLDQAGIERAAGLLACVGTDAENLYILLAAQKKRSDIRLAARASDDENAARLKGLVEDVTVISPYQAAGIDLVDGVLEESRLKT